MALDIDLFHEQHTAELERKRDPLKLGLLLALVVAIGLFAYYMLVSSKAGELQSQLAAKKSEMAKLEPELEKAKKLEPELEKRLASVNALNKATNQPFYVAPVLEKILRKVRPDIQLLSLTVEVPFAVAPSFTVEGTSVGYREEPRIVADYFRRTLEQQLRSEYKKANVNLSEINAGAPVEIAGKVCETARFVLRGVVEIAETAGGTEK